MSEVQESLELLSNWKWWTSGVIKRITWNQVLKALLRKWLTEKENIKRVTEFCMDGYLEELFLDVTRYTRGKVDGILKNW